jgi:hypothetical protein
MIGTPPNCRPIVIPKCPSGTIGIPPNCKPVAKPNGATPSTVPR